MTDSITRSRPHRGAIGALVFLSTLVAACGGGGGGGAGSTSSSFILTDVKYGRLTDDGTGPRLVSPLTTVEIDPITGFAVPGSLQPLAVGVDVNAAQTFTIGANYLPCVVPRNGVLQLEFSAPVNANSIVADVVDANGAVLSEGSVQVRSETGKGVAVTLTQPTSNVIWINPVTTTTIGFPASPVDFGPGGEPRANATGFLHLILPKTGPAVLESSRGATLGFRSDHLGDVDTPVGFNPGNRVLDFISQNQLIPTGETFNGFLPDIAPPRILRTHVYSKTLAFGSGDGATATSIDDVTGNFSSAAKNGLGEWANARLTLRPGLANQEVHFVLGNSAGTVTIVDTFAALPQNGDVYRLERAEFFEPDPAHPIDPATYDPNDPENANNALFVNFVELFEIDANGNAVSGPLDVSQPIPPFSELRVHFNEPIASESVGAYEDFQVRFDPDQGPGSEILSQAVVDPATQTTVVLRPALEDQVAGTFQVVGWGKTIKALRFDLTTVPKPGYLQENMPPDDAQAFLDQGFRGVTDLGGQPLAFPDSIFSAANPAITFSLPFTTDVAASTQIPPPVVESYGVMVHRMQGRPLTGVDPATGNPGVKYVDQVNYYTPIADINLQANGFLAGSPIVYITKIHDDFFPPPHGQYGPYALGAATPLSSFNPVGGPAPHDGARFQTVYRDIDASPSRDALAGTLLDLYRLSWAPIGGFVTTDHYDDVSVHCAHSSYRPMTTAAGGGPAFPSTGLGQPFDFDAWKSLVDPNVTDACGAGCQFNQGPNFWDTLVTTVLPGTPYKVTQASLFTPPFDGHPYCPWPTFNVSFQYNNGDLPKVEKDLRTSMNSTYNCSGGIVWYESRNYDSDLDIDNLGGDSLLVEYRIRPQTTNISRANGFTFAIGILSSSSPNFRVYSVGSPGLPVNPDDVGDKSPARCAIGNTTNPQGSNPFNGDNDRYFAAFDYIKTTSIITSPYARVFPILTTNAQYFTPVIQPDPGDQPAGTSVKLEFQGANNNKGAGGTGFSLDINVADGKPNVAFRATFVGNVTTLLLPNFDLIAIPYLRPQGD